VKNKKIEITVDTYEVLLITTRGNVTLPGEVAPHPGQKEIAEVSENSPEGPAGKC